VQQAQSEFVIQWHLLRFCRLLGASLTALFILDEIESRIYSAWVW
jgi:hypothetical protein